LLQLLLSLVPHSDGGPNSIDMCIWEAHTRKLLMNVNLPSGEPVHWPSAVARQTGPFITHPHPHVGVSAFAFQGTNAHVLLRNLEPKPKHIDSRRAKALWHHQSFWYHPPLNGFLAKASGLPLKDSIVYNMNLSQPSLSFLWDHQVRRLSSLPPL
jgi:hypothetical protein